MRSLQTAGALFGACLLAAAPAVAQPADRYPDDPQTPAGYAQRVDEPYYTGAPVGRTDQTYTTWNSSLFVGGAVVFGAAYGAAVIGAANSETEADQRLYVPLLGPWLDLADRGDCNVENRACDDETTIKVLIVGDGILQAGGALMMVGSLLFPKTVTHSAPATAMQKVKPIRVGTGGRGLAYTGTF